MKYAHNVCPIYSSLITMNLLQAKLKSKSKWIYRYQKYHGFTIALYSKCKIQSGSEWQLQTITSHRYLKLSHLLLHSFSTRTKQNLQTGEFSKNSFRTSTTQFFGNFTNLKILFSALLFFFYLTEQEIMRAICQLNLCE